MSDPLYFLTYQNKFFKSYGYEIKWVDSILDAHSYKTIEKAFRRLCLIREREEFTSQIIVAQDNTIVPLKEIDYPNYNCEYPNFAAIYTKDDDKSYPSSYNSNNMFSLALSVSNTLRKNNIDKDKIISIMDELESANDFDDALIKAQKYLVVVKR